MARPLASSAPDPVLVFMQQLGMHPAEQMKLGWIAEYGMKEEAMPPRWTLHVDRNSGHVYYVDRDSQTSSWENPLAPALLKVLEVGRRFLQQPTNHFFEDRKKELWHEHRLEIQSWCGPFKDGKGRPYFANSTTGVSSWRDPREETQYIFEMQSGLLATLEALLPSAENVPVYTKPTRRSTRRRSQASPPRPPGSDHLDQAMEAWASALMPLERRRGSTGGSSPKLPGDVFRQVGGAEILTVGIDSRTTSPQTEVINLDSIPASRELTPAVPETVTEEHAAKSDSTTACRDTADAPVGGEACVRATATTQELAQTCPTVEEGEGELAAPAKCPTVADGDGELAAPAQLRWCNMPPPEKFHIEPQSVSIVEHKMALKKMGDGVRWFHETAQEELEAQRMLLSKRRSSRRLSSIGCDGATSLGEEGPAVPTGMSGDVGGETTAGEETTAISSTTSDELVQARVTEVREATENVIPPPPAPVNCDQGLLQPPVSPRVAYAMGLPT